MNIEKSQSSQNTNTTPAATVKTKPTATSHEKSTEQKDQIEQKATDDKPFSTNTPLPKLFPDNPQPVRNHLSEEKIKELLGGRKIYFG